jgi:ABC-type transport system substrate-binding protein
MQHKTTKRDRWLVLVFVIALVAAACSSAGTGEETTTTASEGTATTAGGGEEPTTGGRLVYAAAQDLEAFDIELAVGGAHTISIHEQIYGYLTRMTDDRLGIEGEIAESWEYSEDGTQLTLKLRDGVLFHDGSPVTVEDVLFSLATSQAGANWGFALADMTFEAPDDSTVVITTPFPNFDVPGLLSVLYVPIYPADFGGVSREEFFANPIGAGPFKFGSWTPGDEVVLSAFDDYWRGRPKIDELVYKTISDPNAGLLAYENGEIQVWRDPPIDLIDTLPGSVEEFPMLENVFVFFNSQAEPLADVKVRQAIMHAIDREALREGVTSGYSREATGFQAPDTLWPELGPGPTNPISYDPDKARALLAEAGVADGLKLSMMIPIGFTEVEASAQIIQQQLAEVGIELEIELLDLVAFFEKGFSGGHELGIFNYGFIVPAASESIVFVFGTGGVFGGYDASPLLDVFVQYVGSTEPSARAEAFTAFEDWITDNGALFSLYNTSLVQASQNVEGLIIGKINLPRFTEVVVTNE